MNEFPHSSIYPEYLRVLLDGPAAMLLRGLPGKLGRASTALSNIGGVLSEGLILLLGLTFYPLVHESHNDSASVPEDDCYGHRPLNP